MTKKTRTMRSFADGVRRSDKATKIMGKAGRAKQMARNRKAQGAKAKGREAIKRVGEYKKAAKSHMKSNMKGG